MKFQIERVPVQTDGFDGVFSEELTDFGSGIDGRIQSKLMAMIFTCESDTAILAKPPKALNGYRGVLVENENPIALAPDESLEPVPDEPIQFIHGTCSLLNTTHRKLVDEFQEIKSTLAQIQKNTLTVKPGNLAKPFAS